MIQSRRFTQYGNCKVFTDFKAKRFYPADYSKGWIARSYLYMSETYHIRLSNQEKKLMESWSKKYPASEKEKVFREFVTKQNLPKITNTKTLNQTKQ